MRNLFVSYSSYRLLCTWRYGKIYACMWIYVNIFEFSNEFLKGAEFRGDYFSVRACVCLLWYPTFVDNVHGTFTTLSRLHVFGFCHSNPQSFQTWSAQSVGVRHINPLKTNLDWEFLCTRNACLFEPAFSCTQNHMLWNSAWLLPTPEILSMESCSYQP